MSHVPPSITVGFSGEENSRPIAFDISTELTRWPGTTPELWYVRPGENVSYKSFDTVLDGTTFTWTPNLHVTEYAGDTGIAQIIFTKDLGNDKQLVGATKRIMMTVIPSVIPIESSEVPDPLVNWVTQMRNATNAANTAAELATTKAGLADDAATLANTKAGLADTAATNANTKAALADEKATLADTKAGLANDAATLANTKAALADTEATNAYTKAVLADTAATNANTKAGLADTAATNANTKAALADEKATLADTKAGLANTAAASANSAATSANAAAAMITNMTVDKTQLADGATPTVTVSDVSGRKHILFGVADGIGISGIQVRYQKHNSGTSAPTGDWKETPSEAGAGKGEYLWTRLVISRTNNSTQTYYSISYLGTDGTGAVTSVNNMTGDVTLSIPTKTSDLTNDSGFIAHAGSAMSIQLVVANWSGTPLTQTITNLSGISSESNVIVSAAPSDRATYAAAGIACTAQGNESLTFTADSQPASAVYVNVFVLS